MLQYKTEGQGNRSKNENTVSIYVGRFQSALMKRASYFSGNKHQIRPLFYFMYTPKECDGRTSLSLYREQIGSCLRHYTMQCLCECAHLTVCPFESITLYRDVRAGDFKSNTVFRLICNTLHLWPILSEFHIFQ